MIKRCLSPLISLLLLIAISTSAFADARLKTPPPFKTYSPKSKATDEQSSATLPDTSTRGSLSKQKKSAPTSAPSLPSYQGGSSSYTPSTEQRPTKTQKAHHNTKKTNTGNDPATGNILFNDPSDSKNQQEKDNSSFIIY
jgi:hypothetical protein